MSNLSLCALFTLSDKLARSLGRRLAVALAVRRVSDCSDTQTRRGWVEGYDYEPVAARHGAADETEVAQKESAPGMAAGDAIFPSAERFADDLRLTRATIGDQVHLIETDRGGVLHQLEAGRVLASHEFCRPADAWRIIDQIDDDISCGVDRARRSASTT